VRPRPQVLDDLTEYVATESFLHTLERARLQRSDLEMTPMPPPAQARAAPPLPLSLAAPLPAARAAHPLTRRIPPQAAAAPSAPPLAAPAAGHPAPGSSGQAAAAATAAAAAAADPDDFVVLEREDAVEAIAYYIATYVARTPEAQRMEPRQLHAALQQTFKVRARSRARAGAAADARWGAWLGPPWAGGPGARRQRGRSRAPRPRVHAQGLRRSRFRLVWDWGRYMYRWSAMAYSMVRRQHPPAAALRAAALGSPAALPRWHQQPTCSPAAHLQPSSPAAGQQAACAAPRAAPGRCS
jgi:hypothetical protein